MLRTEQHIEGDIYKIVSESALGKAVRGRVYRPDMRPDNARGEDIVVKFLAGQDAQFQTAEVVVNVYVADMVTADGQRVRDFKRIEELEELVHDMVRNDSSDYGLETAGTPTVIHHEEIDQYCLNVRLRVMNISN